LSSNDDPILGNKCIPIDKVSENVMIGVTKAGGHVGYFHGFIAPRGQWFTEPAFEFVNYFVD